MKVITKFVTMAVSGLMILTGAAIPASAQTVEPEEGLEKAVDPNEACFVKVNVGFSRVYNKYTSGAVYITSTFSRESSSGATQMERPVESCSGYVTFKGASRAVPEAAVNPTHPGYSTANADLKTRVITALNVDPRTVAIYPLVDYHRSSGSLTFVEQPRQGVEEFLCFVYTTARFSRDTNPYQYGAIYLDANFSRERVPGARNLTRPVGDCRGKFTYKGNSSNVPEAAVNSLHPDHATANADLQTKVFNIVNSDNRSTQPYPGVNLTPIWGYNVVTYLPTDFNDPKWDCYLSEPTVSWSRTGEERFRGGAVYQTVNYSRTETPGSKKLPYPMVSCSATVTYKGASWQVPKESVDPANPSAAEFSEARFNEIFIHQVVLFRLAPEIALLGRLVPNGPPSARVIPDSDGWTYYQIRYATGYPTLLNGLLVN